MDEMELNTLIKKMPIGTPVRYFPVFSDHTKYVDTVTRSLPWRAESGNVVVMIKGKSGYVAVSNIRFLPTVDPLLAEVKRIVLEIGEVRVGRIQREMRIGYTRAARLIDLMCEDGFLMRNEEGVPILVTIIEKEVRDENRSEDI